jgi:hypothetical protein
MSAVVAMRIYYFLMDGKCNRIILEMKILRKEAKSSPFLYAHLFYYTNFIIGRTGRPSLLASAEMAESSNRPFCPWRKFYFTIKIV